MKKVYLGMVCAIALGGLTACGKGETNDLAVTVNDKIDLDEDKEYTLVVEYTSDEKEDDTVKTEVKFKTDDINNLEEEFKKPLNANIDEVIFGKELSNDMKKEKSEFNEGFLTTLKYTFDEYKLTDKEQEAILKAVKKVYGKTGGLEINTDSVNSETGSFEVSIPSLDLSEVDELETYIESLANKYKDEDYLK